MYSIEKLYDRHFDSVYRYVYYRLRHVQDTEDVVASSFMKAAEKLPNFQAKQNASVRSWLFAIVRNTIIDHYRKQKHRNHEDIDSTFIADPPQQARILDCKLAYESVMKHLSILSAQQREIVLLRYHSGLRNKEIAELLGIEAKSVSSVLTKAKKTLKERKTIINPYE